MVDRLHIGTRWPPRWLDDLLVFEHAVLWSRQTSRQASTWAGTAGLVGGFPDQDSRQRVLSQDGAAR